MRCPVARVERPPSQFTHAFLRGIVSKAYQLFCFDRGGRILSVDWLVAADDDEALAAANDVDNGTTREIWERNRLVGRIGPRPSSASLR